MKNRFFNYWINDSRSANGLESVNTLERSRLSVSKLFCTERQLAGERKLVLKLLYIWSVFHLETLVRKRREHGESNSSSWASEPVEDRTTAQLCCCGIVLCSHGAELKPTPASDLLLWGPAAALLHAPSITEILERDYKFWPEVSIVEVEFNIPFWVQCLILSNAWEENKHSPFFFSSSKFLPSAHFRTLLTTTPDCIWASGLQRVLLNFRLCNKCFGGFTFSFRRCKFLFLLPI